jgi:hypothetical protein
MKTRYFPFQLSRNDSAAALSVMRPDRTVVLVADDTTPIDQQLALSFNANNAVMAYVLALTGSTLPALSPQPDWYQAFVTQFSSAKTHAMEWQNSVTPGLVSIPTGILNYALLWGMNTSTITQAIEVLNRDPGNQQARQTILASLQSLQGGVSQQLATASNFQQTIDSFATQLTGDAQAMRQAIQNASSSEGYDQQQVQRLTNDINDLNDEISKWQTVVTAAGIGAGVAFFAGAVIAMFSFGAGLAFGIVGASAGIATIVAAEVKIQELATKIAQDQGNMSSLNQQIAALKVIESNLTTLNHLSSAASQQVQLIIQAWQSLEQELNQVVGDLTAAQGDLSRMNLPQLQADMAHANADWQALQSFCSVIAGIHYNEATPATVTLQTTRQLIGAGS